MTAALVLIDIQKGLDDPWFGHRNNAAMEANALRILSSWRKAGWPVVIVQHASRTEGSPLRPDQPGHALKAGFEPLEGEKHIVKSANSAFIGTDLEAWLRSNAITEIVVAGITTEHCVSTTVRMAANLGFKVTLVGNACHATSKRRLDGIATIDADTVHDTELAILDGEFATVTTTNDLLCKPREAVNGELVRS